MANERLVAYTTFEGLAQPLPPVFTASQVGAEAQADAEAEVPLAQAVVAIVHPLLPSDTLQGILRRYGVTLQQLKQANPPFPGEDVHALRELVIPPSLTAPLGASDLQQVLAALPELDEAEAEAYLRLSDGDVDAAVQQARGDAEWALTH